MADRQGQFDNSFSGGSDVWDDGLAGELLLQDYFDTTIVDKVYVGAGNRASRYVGAQADPAPYVGAKALF